jgi:hypothetical protein
VLLRLPSAVQVFFGRAKGRCGANTGRCLCLGCPQRPQRSSRHRPAGARLGRGRALPFPGRPHTRANGGQGLKSTYFKHSVAQHALVAWATQEGTKEAGADVLVLLRSLVPREGQDERR